MRLPIADVVAVRSRELSRLASGLLVAIEVIAVLGLVTAPAFAASGFCETKVVHNYARPLERMPALRSVPADRKLPFGPRGVYLFPRSEGQVLLPEVGGRVGYTLKILRSGKLGNPNLPPLNWLVSAKLARVDSRGRARELLAWRRQHVTGPHDNGSFGFEPPGKLGFYRVEIVFRNNAGKRLGRFGEYFRVVSPISDARLTLNGTSFQPGETVSACLENYGTESLSYGLGYIIESFDGSTWTRSPIHPPEPVPEIELIGGAGKAALVGDFQIPAAAPPSLYRWVWIGDAFRGHPWEGNGTPLTLTSEFQILATAN